MMFSHFWFLARPVELPSRSSVIRAMNALDTSDRGDFIMGSEVKEEML